MKIKCITFAILFCFVSSSALAWPWRKKVESPQRISIPSASAPYVCKPTPELIDKMFHDIYACGYPAAPKEFINEYLESQIHNLNYFNRFLEFQIVRELAVPRTGGPSISVGDLNLESCDERYPAEASVGEKINVNVQRIDCLTRDFDKIYNKFLEIGDVLRSYIP